MDCTKKPLITFAMCTYNDASLLTYSIESLLHQDFKDWELLVLDNSTTSEEPWRILSNYANYDSRIKISRSEENVGWAKGMSLILEKASGKYATFLAADDFIEEDALSGLAKVMTESAPDIIWVGYRSCVFEGQKLFEVARNIPEYRIYANTHRSTSIAELMQTVYYNSLFHYMNVDFLKKNHIDFFSPYYSDCGSMTVAMCKATHMITYPGIIYNLVLNTSQTAGHYVMDSYKTMFAVQWEAISEIHVKEHASYKSRNYVAERIGRNYFANLGHLCSRRCRNRYMNNISITMNELASQLIEALSNTSLQNLHYYMGAAADESLLSQLQLLEFNPEDIADTDIQTYVYHSFAWIAPVILLTQAQKKKNVTIEETLSYLLDFLLRDENKSCMGFGYMSKLIEQCSDAYIEAHANSIQQIIDKYNQYTNALH